MNRLNKRTTSGLWGLLTAMIVVMVAVFGAVIELTNVIAGARTRPFRNAGGPLSGTSGTFAGQAGPGDTLLDTTNGVEYINEGTKASPYWTPTSYKQAGLKGVYHDFNDSAEIKAVADTNATAVLNSGLRVFGQGIADTDSGLTHSYEAEEGGLGALLTTNETAHLAALGMGDTTLLFQPDTHGPLVIDVEFTHDTAITARATFLGFLGAVVDALDPAVTGATVTLTLVQNDLAGMFQDSGLTDADGVFLPHNKGDEAATLAVTATGVDPSVTIAAAGTFQRWRVEISRAGVMTAFVDKVQVGTIAAALAADEEVMPAFYVEANATAIKQANVRRIAMYGTR